MSKLYDVILADPPWSFKVWNRDTGSGRSAEAHYNTMTLDDICALPIKQLAAPNCALFLWAVWPSIFDAQRVIESWGFKYKTLGFEWWKLNKLWTKLIPRFFDTRFGIETALNRFEWFEQMFFFGMGYYTRTNSEPCLLSTRGSMPVAVHNERNYLISPIRAHSQKPWAQYRKIERLYPNRNYLELFARDGNHKESWEGWDVWGNEAKDSITLPEAPSPSVVKCP